MTHVSIKYIVHFNINCRYRNTLYFRTKGVCCIMHALNRRSKKDSHEGLGWIESIKWLEHKTIYLSMYECMHACMYRERSVRRSHAPCFAIFPCGWHTRWEWEETRRKELKWNVLICPYGKIHIYTMERRTAAGTTCLMSKEWDWKNWHGLF